MTVAILATDLAELARPVSQDTRKAGVSKVAMIGMAAVIEAASDGPATIQAIFGVSVHAERVLRLKDSGGRELFVRASANQPLGAGIKRVSERPASSMPSSPPMRLLVARGRSIY